MYKIRYFLYILVIFIFGRQINAQDIQSPELEHLLILDFAADSKVSKSDKEKVMTIIRSEIEKLKVFQLKDKDAANQNHN
jgi:hypothetical protein